MGRVLRLAFRLNIEVSHLKPAFWGRSPSSDFRFVSKLKFNTLNLHFGGCVLRLTFRLKIEV